MTCLACNEIPWGLHVEPHLHRCRGRRLPVLHQFADGAGQTPHASPADNEHMYHDPRDTMKKIIQKRGIKAMLFWLTNFNILVTRTITT